MVRHYVKKGTKVKWTEGDLKLALDAVKSGKSILGSAEEYGIPRSTLQTKLYPSETKAVGFKRYFSESEEQILADHIEYMEKCMLGLTVQDIRKLAFALAQKLGVANGFNTESGLAGRDWMASFMERKGLTVRKAEHTSAARVHGFNQDAVTEFFRLLKLLYDQHGFKPQNVYNVDESGISVVPKSAPKVVAKKGRRQVGGLTAAERGENVTAEICMSAAGSFMPLMLVFPRVHRNPEFLEGCPPGSWAEFHKTGYVQTEIFYKWFNEFVTFSRASKDNPVLLVLDGHASHIKNLDLIELAKNNGVSLLCLPPHTTHKMQPLDVGFMQPLSHNYTLEVSSFQQKGKKVTLKQVFHLLGNAYMKAAKIETAVNAFRKTGIYPFNPDIFNKDEFPADQTAGIENKNLDSPKAVKCIEALKELTHVNKPQEALKSLSLSRSEANENIQGGYVTIPIDHLIRAAPLIQILSNTLNSIENQSKSLISTNLSKGSMNFSALNYSSENSTQSDNLLSNSHHLNSSFSLDFQDSNLPNNTPVQHTTSPIVPSKKGKAEILTCDDYTQKLIAQKMRSMKKEKVEKCEKNRVQKKAMKKASAKAPKITNKRIALKSISNTPTFQDPIFKLLNTPASVSSNTAIQMPPDFSVFGSTL